ncbi:hypothetical protein DCO58_02495 [Helicobacter saguini]|uniref:Uncharacterized protein n=1 Tax=Helicobacter saguini TaxID=1548018 RepID=A0A347VRW2_9HELI|nr:hypothetical protein [Helicobacter saguini]MWV62754.1 hypothetical protein [Helicobacter saguini]MWV66577.1 hypothetical protein [Helicobacter saguini]MWV71519.1 hypothetical protein [Helicobacter saguini]TLD93617.1 hypothetical protein LS64_008280 [Helicobacter saguini]
MVITDTKALLQEVNKTLRLATQKNNHQNTTIDFICPNFYAFYQSLRHFGDSIYSNIFKYIMYSLFNLVQKDSNIKVTIYTFNVINYDINLKDLNKQITIQYLESFKDKLLDFAPSSRKYINIQSYCNIDNSIIKFIQGFEKISNNKDIKTLNNLLESININKLHIDNFKDIKQEIIKNINLIIESRMFDNIIKLNLKDSFESFFDDFIMFVRQLIESRDNEKYKLFIKCIFDVIINITLLFNPYTAILGIVGVGGSIASFLYEYNNLENKAYHKILSPIAKLLVSEFGVFITYINTTLLSSALIVDKKEIIDLSCFNLMSSKNHSNIESNLAFKFTLENEIDLDKFFMQDSQVINLSYNAKLYTKDILQKLKYDIAKFNHISYIQSPHFNSSVLAELIANKNTTSSTTMNRNYIIITNAPTKYNAKLTETITQEILSNHIENKYTQPNPFRYNQNNKNYNSKRNFSDYVITLEDGDNKPYILQLSVFVKISKKKYEYYKEKYDDIKKYSKKSLTEKLIQFEPEMAMLTNNYFDKKIESVLVYKNEAINYEYIKQFFKQKEEKESIIKKEIEMTREYINALKVYYISIRNNNMKYRSNTYEFYTLMDCLKIALTLYHLKKLFLNIEIVFVESRNIIIKFNNADCSINMLSHALIGYKKNAIDVIKNIYDILESNKDLNNDKEIESFFDNIEKEMQDSESLKKEIIENYGERYIQDSYKQSVQKVISVSVCKILSSACPFINFMLDSNYIQSMERILKYMIIHFTQGFEQSLLETIGIFHLIKQQISPDKTYVLIDSKKSNETTNSKIKENTKKYIRALAIAELRLTKKQLAHFAAKEAIITGIKLKLENEKRLNLSTLKDSIKKHLKNTKTKDIDKTLIDNIYFYYDATQNQTYQQHLIGKNQFDIILKEAKKLPIKKVLDSIKNNFKYALIDAGVSITLEYIFPSNYEALKKQYDNIIHTFYTDKYDAPYAVIKEDYVTYPFVINDSFISFDFKKLFYGIKLHTGVFYSHLNFHYELESSEDAHILALKRLLSYLILEKKRAALTDTDINDLDDITFFNKNLNTIKLGNRANIYKLKDEKAEQEYIKSGKTIRDTPILLYNEAIGILADYAEYYYNNSYINNKWRPDKDKARRLVRALNAIGENNIKAMYYGVDDGDESCDHLKKKNHSEKTAKKEKPPEIIGRLITNIIMSDGLWIG